MIYGSLFSGIGGFDLGLDRAGMQCAWQVEIDPFCRRVLAKHWPDVPKFTDVRNVGRNGLAAVDLICGGFPCQPHSLAGKRRGKEDDRNLWPEYRRIVAELRPRWVLAENVPGIRTTILDEVLSDLEGLDYTVRTVDLPAVAFDAWHRRHRIFIVAHTDRSSRPGRADEQIGGAQGRDAFGRENAYASHPDRPGRNGTTMAMGQSAAHQADAYPVWPSPANAESFRQSGTMGQSDTKQPPFAGGAWWDTEPGVARVVHGVPHRVDRIRGLGNAVVPVIAQFLGELIMQADHPGIVAL